MGSGMQQAGMGCTALPECRVSHPRLHSWLLALLGLFNRNQMSICAQ